MSNRKILNAASTGGIGYYPVAGASTDAYYDNVSLLLTGDTDVDSNFANVSLLLDGNTLTDKSNNKATITANGNAAVTSNFKKFGTGSLYFPYTSTSNPNYFTIPFVANGVFDNIIGNWTIEFWYYRPSAAGAYEASSSNRYEQLLGTTVDNICPFYLLDGKPSFWNGTTYTFTSTPLTMDVWYHIAVVCSNNTVTCFLNGVAYATTATHSTRIFSGGSIIIGKDYYNNGQTRAYVDDLRITKGVARYTANFTPPVKALPTHEILDSSVYRLPVTAYGNARIDTATKKYGTGSMYFDGTGDYLNLPSSTTLNFGTSNFTIEFWINVTALDSQYPMILSCASPNNYLGISKVSASTYKFASNFVSSSAYRESTTVLNIGTWYYIAVVRSGTTLSFYINNTLDGSVTETGSLGGTTVVSIGYNPTNYSNMYYFNGYIDDLRVTKGVARTITQPTAALPTIPPTIPADPWWGNVSLLLDGNTTDAYDPYWQNVSLMLTGDDFIDWSNNHLAISNTNITRSTTIKKYGTSSLAFNGVSGNALSITSPGTTNSIGAGDFTVEAWAYYLDITGWRDIICFVGPASWGITTSGGNLGAYGIGIDYSGTIVPINQWFHVAVTRQSGTVRLFLNGGLVTSATNTTSFTNTQINIGSWINTGNENLNGYIAELRVTKGVARYTANFTLPTAALPSFKIQDRTQNALTLTPYGNVQLSTDVMKNGTGSMFFDGVGDNVSIANTPYLTLGSGDFTIEGWFNQSSTLSYAHIFTTTSSYGTANNLRMTISGGAFNVYTSNAGLITPAGSVTNGTWYHFALVRTGTTLTLYSNGVSIGTTTTSVSFIMDTFMVGGEGTYPFNGYIDDFRVTKGYARYTQNFTPPSQSFATQYISTGYDPNYADVSLLLNGNGTNGSTTFTDLSSSPKTVTVNGTMTVNTSIKKYGTGSIFHAAGSTNYLSLPGSLVNFGTGDFTIEFWGNTTNTSSSESLGMAGNVTGSSIMLAVGPGGNGSFSAGVTSSSWNLYTSTNNLQANTWYHFAVTRKNGTAYLFINGAQIASAAWNTNFINSTAFEIGRRETSYGAAYDCYYDDIRITNGVARYTTNFTPPTYQLPTDTTGTVIDPLRASTSLLLRGNGTNGSTSFTDESPNGLTVTNNGSVTVNTTTKKYGTGSMAFNGTSQYLSIASSSSVAFGTGDFTVEAWVYPTATGICNVFQSRSGIPDGPWLGVYNGNMYWYDGTIGQWTTTSAVPNNTWSHLVWARYSGTCKMFVNGVDVGSTKTASGNYTYTTAMIGYDVSNAGNYFSGYIDDLRVTKGYARYTANFTPPTYEDPIVTGTVLDYNYPQVSLLLNGDGTNGSTTFTDLSSSPKTITNTGSVSVNTTTKKFGTGSMYFNGSSSTLSTVGGSPFNMGTSDMTLEAWVYPTSTSENTVFDTNWGTLGAYQFSVIGNGVLTFYYKPASGNINVSGGTVALNQWSHVACVRILNTVYLYVNGVQVNSASFTQAFLGGTTIYIGSQAGNFGFYSGYIDDLRITKGLARYATNFTPPTAPLPTSYS